MRYLVTILTIVAISACAPRKNKELQVSDAGNLSDIPEVFDTLVVEGNIAILWWPDSSDQVIMKENYDEISYNKFVDDMTWYTQNAVEMFDSMGVANKVTARDFVVFKKPDHSEVILKRKEVKGNLVLLHEEKEPLILSLDNYNRRQISEYFK